MAMRMNELFESPEWNHLDLCIIPKRNLQPPPAPAPASVSILDVLNS